MTGSGNQAFRSSPHAFPCVAILLSQRLATLSSGLDLGALQDWLCAMLPTVQVRAVSDPVRRTGEIARAIAAVGAERLVLGLAGRDFAAGVLQAEARKAGLDPLGVEAVNLGAGVALPYPRPVAMERAKLLLAAAVARVRAFPGSRPEHLKSSFSVAVSRRALFTLSARECHAVPSIWFDRCAADIGCHRCVDVCAPAALRLEGQTIAFAKVRCESCGLCLSACPTGAIEYPGCSLAELDAQIAALVDPEVGNLQPRAILFVCRRRMAALDTLFAQGFHHSEFWLQVAVSCAGMLSPAILLRCLAGGAATVGVVACDSHCPFGQDTMVVQRIAFCQELLQRIGISRDRIRLCSLASDYLSAWVLPTIPATDNEPPVPPRTWASTGDPRAFAEAVLSLAGTNGAAADLTLTHPQSPFGIIRLDPQGCTACQSCVADCSTGALAVERNENSIAISFDAALCNACGLCVPRCPEVEHGALRLERRVDFPSLAAGRRTAYCGELTKCQICGALIAPTAMMEHLATLCGEQYSALAPTISHYCSECRAQRYGRR